MEMWRSSEHVMRKDKKGRTQYMRFCDEEQRKYRKVLAENMLIQNSYKMGFDFGLYIGKRHARATCGCSDCLEKMQRSQEHFRETTKSRHTVVEDPKVVKRQKA